MRNKALLKIYKETISLELWLNIVYLQKQSFKQLLWNILWTISILLGTITIINFHRAFKNLCAMGDFSCTNFLINIVMGCSTKDANYCYFHNAVSNNYFQKVLLINFVCTYANWFKNFSFAHFLLAGGYQKYSLQIELVIVLFIERFKTAATLGKSSKWIFLVLKAICLDLSVLLIF